MLRWLIPLFLVLPLSTHAAMLRWPVEFEQPWTHIASTFGPRQQASNNFNYEFHTGIDIVGEQTDQVVAAADGEVFRIYEEGNTHYPNAGNIVILRHNSNRTLYFHHHNVHEYYTLYFHLSSFADGLVEGQEISAGEVLGNIGQTGNATFDHLHFEVRLDSTCSLASSCNTTGYEPHVHPLRFLSYPEADDVVLHKRIDGNDVIVTIISRQREVDINKIKLNNRVINFSTRHGSADETTSWRKLKPSRFSTSASRYKLKIRYYQLISAETDQLHLQVYDAQGDRVGNRTWDL